MQPYHEYENNYCSEKTHAQKNAFNVQNSQGVMSLFDCSIILKTNYYTT